MYVSRMRVWVNGAALPAALMLTMLFGAAPAQGAPTTEAYVVQTATSTAFHHNIQAFGSGTNGLSSMGTTTAGLAGMDFDPNVDNLYAINATQLGTIDHFIGGYGNGAFSPIASISGAPGGTTWTDLAIDPVSGDAFASTANKLYSMNLGTGAVTEIGNFTGNGGNVVDLAINCDQVMYALDSSSDALYTVNKSTAATTLVGNTAFDMAPNAQGMDFDNRDGKLYAWMNSSSTNLQYARLSTANGAYSGLGGGTVFSGAQFEGSTDTVCPAQTARSISINDVTVTEANGQTNATLTVTANLPTGKSVPFNFSTTNGTATAPGDYTATTGSGLVSSTAASSTITIPITGDLTQEGTENFTVNISLPVGSPNSIGDDTGQVTINDNDGPPTDVKAFVQSLDSESYHVFTHPLNDIATLSDLGSSSAFQMWGIDFNPAATTLYGIHQSSGANNFGTINTTTGAFTPIAGIGIPFTGSGYWTDLVIDPVSGAAYVSSSRELYSINLQTGAVSDIGSFGVNNWSIVDLAIDCDGVMYAHDAQNDRIVKINQGTGAPGEIVGTTGFNAPLVNNTFAGQGMDIDNATGALYIWGYTGGAPATPQTTFRKMNTTTGIVETLASASGQYEGAVQSQCAAGRSISIDDVTVTEGDTGTANATLTVTADAPTGKAVTFNYATADDGATQPGDYTSATGSGTIPANAQSTTINVPINGDTANEATESLTVNLSNVNAGNSIGDGSGTITISDNDVAGPVDADGDGSSPPADCNDANNAVHPGAVDIPDNGIDEDCSGADATTGGDADGDGSTVPADCNDANNAIHPGATDVPGNGIDEDCSGADATAPGGGGSGGGGAGGGGGSGGGGGTTGTASTGERAAALKKCKKKKGAAKQKCTKKAKKLPA